MLQSIALAVIRWLENLLDPKYKADLAAWRKEREAVNAAIATEKQAVEEGQRELERLKAQSEEINRLILTKEQVVSAAQAELKRIQEDEQEKIDKVRAADDSSILRSDL